MFLLDYTLTGALLEERLNSWLKIVAGEFHLGNDVATIANLVQELPLYLVASDGVIVTCGDHDTEKQSY